jgi:hypothetical protein
MSDRVLVIGYSRETVVQHVLELIAGTGPFTMIELADFYRAGRVIADAEAPCEALIELGRHVIRLGDFSGVFQRIIPPISTENAEENRRRISRYIALERALSPLPSLVINRPGTGWENSSKPLQTAALGRFGFRVPDFMSTSCPENAREWQSHHRTIFKSNSALRSIVDLVENRSAEDLQFIEHCPVLFQQFISGDDVRVHVVGTEAFGVRIESDAVDYRYYRYQGTFSEFYPIIVPINIHKLCTTYAASRDVFLSGFDFKVDPNNQWWCLEMNPMPSFESYDRALEGAIATSLCRALRGKT